MAFYSSFPYFPLVKKSAFLHPVCISFRKYILYIRPSFVISKNYFLNSLSTVQGKKQLTFFFMLYAFCTVHIVLFIPFLKRR